MAPNQGNNALYHLDAESENQRLFEIQGEEATNRSLKEVRGAPPSHGDLFSCDSSPTVFDSPTCYTMRSMCLKRDVHSLSPEARVEHESSSTTVDSVFCTGESSSTEVQPIDLMMMELQPDDDDVSPKLQLKRTEARHIEFQGPIADVALVGAGLLSTLFLAQNVSSRHNCDTTSPIYQSPPLYVECVVDSKIDLAYFASADGINVKKYGDLNNLANDIKTRSIPVEPFHVTEMGLSVPCLRETKNVDATIYAQLEFVKLVKPSLVVVQMKIAHAHSNNSHRTTAKGLFGIGYYTNVTERISSSICGDVTNTGR